MPHVLEFLKESLSAQEVIEAQITNLMVRMHDFIALTADEAQREIIADWRNELTFIRNAIRKLAGAETG